MLVLWPTAGATEELIINSVCCATQKLLWAVNKSTAGARMAHLWPSAQSGAWFEAKAFMCKRFSPIASVNLLWSRRLSRVRQAISVSGLRWSRACRHHFSGDSGPGSATCFFGDTYSLQRNSRVAERNRMKQMGEKKVRGLENQSLIYFLYRPEMKTSYRLAWLMMWKVCA